MKKSIKIMLSLLLVCVLALTQVGCGGLIDDGDPFSLGDYAVQIKDYRLAKDDAGQDLVIITYGFKNNSTESASFIGTFFYEVFQDGIGLNEVYDEVIESANYSDANQLREIKQGASLDVEVAYVLNNTTTDIEVEVSRVFSFSDKKITKTFHIQ